MSQKTTPITLSIIVVCYNMRREAARTLYTLSHHYQQAISVNDYQVIVIDNGSSAPLEASDVEQIAPNFTYHYLEASSPSPAAAVNYGIELSSGRYIACIVDGARMVTPKLIHYSLQACKHSQKPYVTALAWHLGPKEQNYSMLEGYNQEAEDALLNSIDWRKNGYRLFDISAQAGSSRMGFLGGLPYESSFFVMKKTHFIKLGGFDERFQSPGGGLVNHAFLNKVVEKQEFDYTVLLGEGSFHQFHGGVATNATPDNLPMNLFLNEYQSIYNTPFEVRPEIEESNINYVGSMPFNARKFIYSNH